MNNEWPDNKAMLASKGLFRANKFCELNGLPEIKVSVIPPKDWRFRVCGYYRPHLGVVLCLEKCKPLAKPEVSRNWSWPGSDTDQEPYGVIAHEVGHHADWNRSTERGSFYGNYSAEIRRHCSGEKPITSYCDGDHEWFAEVFRLFVTNHALLKLLRPNTWRVLRDRWIPVSSDNWEDEIGNAPPRIYSNLRKKICR